MKMNRLYRLLIIVVLVVFVVFGYTFFSNRQQANDVYNAATNPNAQQELAHAVHKKRPAMAVKSVGVLEAYALFQSKRGVFLDARPDRYYEMGHIPGALPFFYKTVESSPLLADLPKDQLVITYCSTVTCPMAEVLSMKLLRMGYTRVLLYSGGMKDWVEGGFPVETGSYGYLNR